MMARLEEDFPEYHPVAVMAEGAIALAEQARKDKSLWPEAVTASDRVAGYCVPKLKAIEVTGNDGGAINILLQTPGDGTL